MYKIENGILHLSHSYHSIKSISSVINIGQYRTKLCGITDNNELLSKGQVVIEFKSSEENRRFYVELRNEIERIINAR